MKSKKIWIIKIFIITLIVSAGFSVVSEVFISNMPIVSAVVVLAALIIVGIVFDIFGVAVSTCDETPFIAMSAKKIKKAVNALPLLKKADVVANIFNDVIGDICGIVSGAAGAAISAKIIASNPGSHDLFIAILISSLISAATVGGKAAGKSFAMKKNKEIVIFLGGVLDIFKFGGKHEKKS